MTNHLPNADPYLPQHGDPSWSAERYQLDLHYAVATNRLRGDVTITATAVDKVGRVVLDLAGLEVAKMTVDGRPPIRYAQRGTRLVVTLRDPVPAGESFSMAIRYSGTPTPLVEKGHGEAGWEELEDGVIVAGQPHGAPTWFPCNDRPDDKASYTIKITTQPDYTVLANGTLVEQEQHGSTVAWTYEQTQPMATYLATVQIGRYEVREQQGSGPGQVPILAVVPPDAGPGFEAAFGRQPEMMATFVDLFGPYPFEGYAAVVTGDDLDIPLESQGLSTFGRNYMTDDWDHVRLVAHELAHQWFGNAVTLRRWRDIWLHEGFACYAEWLWSEASGSESADARARAHHERLAGLDQHLLLSDPGPELMFDDRVYKRGALTLHALRLTVGDEPFFDLLKAWVSENSGGSVETADFVALSVGRLGVELNELFNAWLHELPLPALPAATPLSA
ncbi:MAG: M1 family metallopeptidase [Nocardioides sp.]|nr:M1 family metallopeptidase [Nocardioides sp.]